MRRAFVGLLFLFCAGPFAFAQQDAGTAYEAMRAVGERYGRTALNQVLVVTGTNGDPQPRMWRILFQDARAPGGLREVDVAGGRIVKQRTPRRDLVGSTQNAFIKTARLNLDSSGAYEVAAYTAKHTEFSTVNYTLRTDDRGNPTWIVGLQNQNGRQVGKMHIGAQRGTVTRTEGLFAPPSPDGSQDQGERVVRRREQPEEDYEDGAGAAGGGYAGGGDYGEEEYYEEGGDPDDGDDDDDNFVQRNIVDFFRRTREETKRVFENARRSFEDYINRG